MNQQNIKLQSKNINFVTTTIKPIKQRNIISNVIDKLTKLTTNYKIEPTTQQQPSNHVYNLNETFQHRKPANFKHSPGRIKKIPLT